MQFLHLQLIYENLLISTIGSLFRCTKTYFPIIFVTSNIRPDGIFSIRLTCV